MIVIVGESASGKSTLQRMLVEKDERYHKIVTYTTRPMRKGENDGIDYHFILEAEFKKLRDEDFFVEYAEYNGWCYGTAEKDCIDSEYGVAVLTPAGLRALKRQGADVTSVYLKVDRRSRLMAMLRRGDDIEEAYRRSLSDVGQFDGIEAEVDCIIHNPKFRLGKGRMLAELKDRLCIERTLRLGRDVKRNIKERLNS